jgi:chitinase
MKRGIIIAGVSVALLVSATSLAAPSGPVEGKKIVGYFVEWGIYGRNYNVADIPADQLTHLNYAFAKINEAGECALVDSGAAIDKSFPGDSQGNGVLRGNFNQLLQLKRRHPHVKTLISVGGWSWSGPFSDAALTEASRGKLARSCVAFMVKYGFDGVDIDWEYPVSGGLEKNKVRPADRENFTLLLAALRKELDDRGKRDKKTYLLTIAAPTTPRVMANLELDKIHTHLSWINLMAYDFHGGWSPVTNFHAPLYPVKPDPTPDETARKHFNVDSAVKAFLAAGVPPEKLVVGVPFFGRGWGGVKNVNHGLYQARANTLPKGTWEAGVFSYKDLAVNYLGKYRRYWHEEAQAPWLYDETSGIMIGYEDVESLRVKAGYINQHNLGGAMIWELSLDDKDATLLKALAKGLRPDK